jgi:hypothetical protein
MSYLSIMQGLSTLTNSPSSTTTPAIHAFLLDTMRIVVQVIAIAATLFFLIIFLQILRYKESLVNFLQLLEDGEYECEEGTSLLDSYQKIKTPPNQALHHRQWKEKKAASCSSSSCPICLLDYQPNEMVVVATSTCEHVFHKECLAAWCQTSPTCPCCREKTF